MIDLESIIPSCINDDESPWIWFDSELGAEPIGVKYFQFDPVRGESIFLSKIPKGTLVRHYHSGPVIVYTLEGSWRYIEHDWVARKGSVVYETAASFHTPEILETVTVLNIVWGETQFLDDDGAVTGVESWRTHFDRYLAYCKEKGIEARDLTDLNNAEQYKALVPA